ncbi:APSES transcription factor Xbp1 [Drepanopeziza brunnea f. sp. 'multigermtubi' MB_m1]|uniref:APSES transcription factor Xbp1 n=1 Tax=Marssonina brunnea f. sp. multigermtubi (strain MB_m1) TaxID=1072389 RepID=K1WYV8_MARBU|nr:APSES transcription factor Xbp1 [Drepanopeziza brunnea f. sp. 'multigermtubi' MB_m1]EKD17802.1 APSES transcription factor Xbp1 [Drepanopeziza brunnea f. sp. 'multigermtubi' MB_m1]
MTKDGAVFAKGKIKGDVRFAPFERLDEDVLREVQRFHVYPLGDIQEYARHIPYNSEKKSFLEKTGRESFEVFQYVFKLPNKPDKEFVVMWDYNIGLVRITPFFKCFDFSKTTPAKMLNMNPGLKEITHSITGGALAAQGYWMPYACALAVCTTFCAHIAPALIPIFGPSFPSLCVPPEAPEHNRMTIDAAIVMAATAEAEAFRLAYSAPAASTAHYHNRHPKAPSSRGSYSPGHGSDHSMRGTPPQGAMGRSLRLKRAFGGESPYGLLTSTDAEFDTPSESSASNDGPGYFLSPASSSSPAQPYSPSSFLARSRHERQNVASHGANAALNVSMQPTSAVTANPLLSAIPRSAGLADMNMSWPVTTRPSHPQAYPYAHPYPHARSSKRRAEDVDADDEYDGEDSSVADDKASGGMSVMDDHSTSFSPGGVGCQDWDRDRARDGERDVMREEVGGAERKAAWLLMKLSVRDGECGATARERAAAGEEEEGPRIKRRRATIGLAYRIAGRGGDRGRGMGSRRKGGEGDGVWICVYDDGHMLVVSSLDLVMIDRTE